MYKCPGMIKSASLSNQINLLKKVLLSSDGIATHATKNPADLVSMVKNKEIGTPLRLAKNIPDLLTETPLANWSKQPIPKEFFDKLKVYESLPSHVRGELRKGSWHYLYNRESPSVQNITRYFDNPNDVGGMFDNSLQYEAALGKNQNWLRRKAFKEFARSYKPIKEIDKPLTEHVKRALGFQNVNKLNTQFMLRDGKMPSDQVSFATHINDTFGNNQIVTTQKKLPKMYLSGRMSYGSGIHEIVHPGPYKIRKNDLILTEGNGNVALKGMGRRTISPKALEVFKKHYGDQTSAFTAPYQVHKVSAYDPPMKDIPEHLKSCPIHSWRADSGIELIHQEPSKKELKRIYKNWLEMTPNNKAVSDTKSKELFGMDNQSHYRSLRAPGDRKEATLNKYASNVGTVTMEKFAKKSSYTHGILKQAIDTKHLSKIYKRYPIKIRSLSNNYRFLRTDEPVYSHYYIQPLFPNLPHANITLSGNTIHGSGPDAYESIVNMLPKLDMGNVSRDGRHAITRTILSHEALEGDAARRYKKILDSNTPYKASFYSHFSPDVLLKEHNIVSTLSGPGSVEAKAFMKKLRYSSPEAYVLEDAARKSGVPFKYGEGRINRHAIKSIRSILNNTTTALGDSLERKGNRFVNSFRTLGTVAKYIGKPTVKWHIDKLLKRI